jgi:PHD/YefM family antitoxin component YafN of YafNO toxin-antitoxin module
MSEGPFQSVDLTAASAALESLFEQVLRKTGRVEITRGDGSEDTCVLISLAELRSLEDALEMLSSTDSCREMRQELLRIANELSPHARPAVAASGVA